MTTITKSLNVSFTLDQEKEFQDYFREFGYVVIRGILTPEDISVTVNEIWQSEVLLGGIKEIKREDPLTWGNESWPTPPERVGKGFFAATDEFKEVASWNNRQNPRVLSAFQKIWGREDLVNKSDRYGLLRPTKNVRLKDGSMVDKPEWKTLDNWLHWDQNPWREPDFIRVQGLLSLTDHTLTSGGFLCVPQFQKQWKEWGISHPVDTVQGASKDHHLVYVPKDDPIQAQRTKILMEAGSLLIWDSRLPHQNFPNEDNTWRMVQYITYSPYVHEEAKKKQRYLKNQISTGLVDAAFVKLFTELGRKIVGLDLWKEDEGAQKIEQNILELSDNEIKALEYFKKAEECEANGDGMQAVSMYKKAFQLNPKLEDIFNG